MTDYKAGDRVQWNNGNRIIIGTVLSVSKDSAMVRVDACYLKPIWPDSQTYSEIQNWHTWSERMQKTRG